MKTLIENLSRHWPLHKDKPFWMPLRWQMVAILLPLIFLPVMVVSLVGRSVTTQGLTLLITQDAQQRASELASKFSTYYDKNGSWAGVSDVIHTVTDPTVPKWLWIAIALRTGQPFPLSANGPSSNIPPEPPADGTNMVTVAEHFARHFTPEQILITDKSGVIVATDGDSGLGDRLAQSVLDQGVPIVVKNQTVGVLVIGGALGILNQQQSDLIDKINSALLISALIAGGLTVLAGLWLSWQITHPARQLMIGVQRLSRGEWGDPLSVRSRNEFGELTHAFNRMASEVMRQEQLRRQMVADVAHDLRTPLSAMQLEIEALESGFQTPIAAAASLREEVEWLQHLIEDLRLLSLMDADQVSLVPAETPLYTFLADLTDFWQPMADEHERSLTLDASDDLPTLPIDVQRMRRVLGNLLDNALRHTQPGGHIVIRASVEQRGEVSNALIQVSDDGEGITSKDLSRVFERFYRADRARFHDRLNLGGVNGAPGSGLGLSIAQRLVELHGGTIEVKSEAGHGATFMIRLPIAPRPVPLMAHPTRSRAIKPMGDLHTAQL